MKSMLLLFLTISLSAPTFAADEAHRTAPSSDHSITKEKTGQQDTYENADTVRTGQASTVRQDTKACRHVDGTWLYTADVGYSACMKDSRTLKR